VSPDRTVRVVVPALALQLPFGMVFAWGVVAPLVRAQDHWPPLLLGAVFSVTPLCYGVGTAAVGPLADRLPPRRLCWAGLGLLAAGFALAFGAPSGLTFVVGYAGLALGVGGGVALTGAVTALIRALPRRAGTVGGMASAAYAASSILLAPLIAALARSLGWRDALALVATGIALVAAALLLLMPALPAAHRRPAGERPAGVLTAPVGAGALLALCGAMFAAFAVVSVPGQVGPALAGVAAAALAAGNTAGRLIGGALADRLGSAGVAVAVFALDLLAAALLLAHLGPAVTLAAGLGAGLALGGDAGSVARVASEAAPEHPGAAFGLVFAGFAAGAFAGPLIGALAGVPLGWAATAAPAAAGLAVSAGRAAGLGRGRGT
jgi:MFS family permease